MGYYNNPGIEEKAAREALEGLLSDAKARVEALEVALAEAQKPVPEPEEEAKPHRRFKK